MVYWDGKRYVSSKPVLIPDIRNHVTNWPRFRRLTGAWPILSIATYLLRFVIIMAGMFAALWYGVARHGWTKEQYFLLSFLALIPILFCWFLVERMAWDVSLHWGRKPVIRGEWHRRILRSGFDVTDVAKYLRGQAFVL
jgi:hypothetical protein